MVSAANTPDHTHAAILSIGDELVRGQILDTNSKWLSERLMLAGVETVEHVTIGDSRDATADALRRLAALSPLIIVTGGLGPTDDDLTREGLADALGEPLVEDADALRDLKAIFAKRGREITAMQARQALRPRSARCLVNPHGTAPGLYSALPTNSPHQASDVFCLPGPPKELGPMFDRLVLPALRLPPGVAVLARQMTVIGIGEGDAAKRVGGLMARDRNPLVGITASNAVLTWRVLYRGRGSSVEAVAAVDATFASIRSAMGDHVVSEEGASVEKTLLDRLKALGRTLGVVESCTGGLLGEILTSVPGSSSVFAGGLITYSNQSKHALAGVSESEILAHGAVSLPVVRAMALGGLERLGVDHCLSISGVAGPDGGTPDKPVGTVCIAHAWRGEKSDAEPAPVHVEAGRFWMPGGRDQVRAYAARSALGLLHFNLLSPARTRPTLLFEAQPSG